MAQSSGLGTLGKLPQEIRRQVFEAYFEGRIIENRGPDIPRPYPWDDEEAFVSSKWVNDSTPLLLVSIAVHAEAVCVEARSSLRLNLKPTDRRSPPPKLATRVTTIHTTHESAVDYSFLRLDDYPSLKSIHSSDGNEVLVITIVANTVIREGEVNKALTGGHDDNIIRDLLGNNNVAKLLEGRAVYLAGGNIHLVHPHRPRPHIEATFELVARLYSEDCEMHVTITFKQGEWRVVKRRMDNISVVIGEDGLPFYYATSWLKGGR